MEIMDFPAVLIPIYGSWIDFIEPILGSGHSRRTLSLNRTEEDRGSNPLRSTLDFNRSGNILAILTKACIIVFDNFPKISNQRGLKSIGL